MGGDYSGIWKDITSGYSAPYGSKGRGEGGGLEGKEILTGKALTSVEQPVDDHSWR